MLSSPHFSAVVVICCDGFFGIGWPVLKSMSLEKLREELLRFFENVHFMDIQEIASHSVRDDWLYITSSSQNRNIKKYYEDVLDIKFGRRSNLYPSVDLVKAHDNKGYQGLLAEKLGVNYTSQYYLFDVQTLGFPKVAKGVFGAGGTSVKKVRKRKDVERFLFRRSFLNASFFEVAKYIKYFLKFSGKVGVERWDNFKPRELHVLQELHDGLSYDYKVIVFGRKIFVLQRKVRSGDFRASGSGLFDFDIFVSESLLEFSLEVREKLGAPYVSLDVVEDADGMLSCIEYQCVHFGPYAQKFSPFYYENQEGAWEKKDNDTVLERLVVEALVESSPSHTY